MREHARLRWMRWITAALWVLFVRLYLFWAVSGAAGREFDSRGMNLLLWITILLFPLAILSSISLYIRWRISNRHDLNLRLEGLSAQIEGLRQQK